MVRAPDIQPARDSDIAALSALNNRFAPQGLTLPRSEAWVLAHIDDYRVMRDANGHVLGCVCLDDYSPSLVELVSLAVLPGHQGKGLGTALIGAAVALARKRGYPEIFAVSFSDELFLRAGFTRTDIERFPEKKARYAKVSDDEWTVGQKHCFAAGLQEAEIGKEETGRG
ncbi:MAG TPA: GNAT family N-acetyltransferase [Gemmatimonadaceae bacterium]|nr:GNAT family N-acetyltransferase [Gemmatimonadaceae bacterium]